MIREATAYDAKYIADIYNYYVEETYITFEEIPVPELDIRSRMASVQQQSLPWLVAVEDSEVVGYAYATQWKERSAYRYSLECTVYLKNGCDGKGLGTQLYEALLAALKARGTHCVIAVISLPNAKSVALHEKIGMEKVAHFKEVGFKFNQYIDVGFWQLILRD